MTVIKKKNKTEVVQYGKGDGHCMCVSACVFYFCFYFVGGDAGVLLSFNVDLPLFFCVLGNMSLAS